MPRGEPRGFFLLPQEVPGHQGQGECGFDHGDPGQESRRDDLLEAGQPEQSDARIHQQYDGHPNAPGIHLFHIAAFIPNLQPAT